MITVKLVKIAFIGILLSVCLVSVYSLIQTKTENKNLEQVNSDLASKIVSLQEKNVELKNANQKYEDSLLILQKEKENIKVQIKYVYLEADNLKDAPLDTIAKEVDFQFKTSYLYDDSVEKTEGKIIDQKPKIVINPLIAVDYVLAKNLIPVQDHYVKILQEENDLLNYQKKNFFEQIENYDQIVASSQKISQNLSSLLERERRKTKLQEAMLYGLGTSTLCYGLNVQSQIALPAGIVVGIGKYFLFN